MRYYNYLCGLLEGLGVYRTGSGIGDAELYAAGEALDAAAAALARAERESLTATAETDGLRRRETLFARCPVNVSRALRAEAIDALGRIGADDLTLAAVNRTIGGCGIRAAAEETERPGTVRIRFPDTIGVPEEFGRIREIILDIVPCHLAAEFVFRFLTWAECAAAGWTWTLVERAGHTWESFEKAVPA